jgi:hypothetical protein
MRNAALALALVAAYVAGTLAPHASAADSLGAVVSELRGIRTELTQIRQQLGRTSR